MNDTLKAAGRIGAELGAAKAENDKLRGLVRRYVDLFADVRLAGQAKQLDAEARAALSQQAEPIGTAKPGQLVESAPIGVAKPDSLSVTPFAEQAPTDTYTAVDMATAAAQGFRDGQAAVEPAPAQYELLSGFCQWYRGKNGYAPYHPRGSEGAEAFAAGAEWQRTRPAQAEPATAQDQREAIHLAFEHKLRQVNLPAYGEHRGDWRTLTREETADVVLELLRTRPAQTEQQPVAAQIRYRHPQKTMPAWSAWQQAPVDMTKPTWWIDSVGYENEYRLLYAAPLAHTAPQPEQSGLVEATLPAVRAAERLSSAIIHRMTDRQYQKVRSEFGDLQDALAVCRAALSAKWTAEQ